MAIDDLLQQMDQNRARQGYGPRKPGTSQADAAVRSNIERLRSQGVLPGGEQPSAAARAATAPRPTPSIAELPSSPSAAADAPAPRGGRLGSAVRTAGRLVAPVTLGISAADTASTPTEQYYQRFGIQPRNDGSITGDLLPNLGIRALGAASDLGNTLTGGLAGRMFFRDQQPEARPRTPAASAPRPSGAPRAQEEQPAPAGAIYRKGNIFSDQPIAGGVVFDPREMTRGGFAQSRPAAGEPTTAERLQRFVAGREAERDLARARQQQAFAAQSQVENSISARNLAEQKAREARIAARSLRQYGNSARADREIREGLLSAAKSYDDQAIALQAGIGTNPQFIRTPEQEQQLRISQQQADSQTRLADEQAIAQGLSNRQAQRMQQIMEQIEQLGADTPTAQRRALIDRALVAQGKDPDSNRYEAIESVGGSDMFPIKTRSLYDTRTGQIIGGQPQAGAVGQSPQQAQYQEGAIYIDAQGNRARYENGKFVPLN